MIYSGNIDTTKDVHDVINFINKINVNIARKKAKVSKALAYNDFIAFQFKLLFSRHF